MQFIMSMHHFVSEVPELYLFGDSGYPLSLKLPLKADISIMSSSEGNNILMPTLPTFS